MKPIGFPLQSPACGKWLLLACFLLCLSSGSRAQLLMEDKDASDSMRHAIDHLYNFQFDRATRSMSGIRQRYSRHPSFMLFQCMFSYWKNFPIETRPKEFEAYLKNLGAVISAGESLEKKHPDSPEPSYYVMTALLLLARHQSDQGEYIKAVNSTRKAYGYIKRGFEWKARVPEFYFSTGLYNYYRVAFPESHPVYAPFTVFFPEGDKENGLRDLEISSQKALFSRAEALGFLTSINLREELNFPRALQFARQLSDKHPANWIYTIVLAECLLENRKTAQAAELIPGILGRSEPMALQAGYYLKGLMESLKGNSDGARWAFQKSLLYLKDNDRNSKGYASLAYNELAKLSAGEGRRDAAEKYFRQAEKNSSFRKVKSDKKAAGF